MSDHYSTLGLSSSASLADIKAAYRRLVLQYHPDRNTAPRATERFMAIQQAWDVLSDPERKSAYDYNLNYYNTYTQQQQAANNTGYQRTKYTPPHNDPYARQDDLYSTSSSRPPSVPGSVNAHVIGLILLMPLVLYCLFSNKSESPQVSNVTYKYMPSDTGLDTLFNGIDSAVGIGAPLRDTSIIAY